MTLPELVHAYLERANRIFLQAMDEKDADRKARLTACNAEYLAARDAVQKLIDQGPMPAGQIWRLNGKVLPQTAWTLAKEESDAAKR